MRPLRQAVSPDFRCLPALVALAFGGGCGGDPVDPEPMATAITITPAAATLKDAGETVQLTATVTDQNGQAMTGVEVIWSTGDSLIADVSETGLVEGGESGQTTLRASFDTLAAPATITVEPGPRATLYAIHRKMNGDDWIFDNNWKTDAPLDTWHGVLTDAAGNITTLALHNNGVTGTIAPEIGTLRALAVLSIYDNELTGSIPPELGSTRLLRTLSITGNPLAGPLPGTLTRLTLEIFYWNDTDLCAPTDDAFQEWLNSIDDHEGGGNCP